MAIIPCPECGGEVSSAALSCPRCGYPIAVDRESGYVRIKTPNQLVGAPRHSFRKTMVTITAETAIVWRGELGAVARFRVDGPTTVCIDMGHNARQLRAKVYPFSGILLNSA